jgi:hypothetical protein
MEKNKIEQFYKALQIRDFTTMENCYFQDIQYFDPLYGYLKKHEVIAMWKLFYSSLQDYKLDFGNIIDEGDNYYTLFYSFSFFSKKANKLLHRKIKSHIRLVDGFIAEQSNAFSLYEWSKQENGFIGLMLGWNKYYQNRMKLRARRLLFNQIAID